ncbi:TPA: hypothetical protein ACK3Q6_004490 [Burkholderia cepacia]
MKIQFLPVVNVVLTANEWNLFADMEGAEEAARELSNAASDALTGAWRLMNLDEPRFTLSEAARYALDGWQRRAEAFADVGALDTEPRAVMKQLCDNLLRGVTAAEVVDKQCLWI